MPCFYAKLQIGVGLSSVISSVNTLMATPYMVTLKGTDETHINVAARSVDEPLITVTAGGKPERAKFMTCRS